MSDMKPTVSSGKRISGIWFVPIIALLLGIWVVVYGMMNEGPEFQVSFESADDLEAGKTKVKLLSVDIGQVESVALTPDASGVLVTLKLDKDYKHLLTDDTRFWVERVRIGAAGVSGLGTILSGAYIKLSPGESDKQRREFVGLESPPLTEAGAPGVRLVLESDQAGSVSSGDAVLYNGYQVGRVENMQFDQDSQKIRYDIFIDAPYHRLVSQSVRFWNISGISLSASAEGFKVHAGSLETILLGGVAFGEAEGVPVGVPVANETVFALYNSEQQAMEQPYRFSTRYAVSFNQSVGGLVPGAPVEYRGIKVGRVERLLLKEMAHQNRSADGGGTPIAVLIRLEPGRMGVGDSQEGITRMKMGIALGVGNGLRASLESGNLLTGSLLVNLDFHPGLASAQVGEYQSYPTIPTITGGLGQIEQSVTRLLEKLNKLPMEDTFIGANVALARLDESLASLDQILDADATRKLPEQLGTTLVSLRRTLDGLSPDSPIYEELSNSLYELNETLKQFEELTRSLSATATMLPTPDQKDPTPEAKRL